MLSAGAMAVSLAMGAGASPGTTWRTAGGNGGGSTAVSLRPITMQIKGASAQINGGTNRLVVKCDKWMVLWRGIERLGPIASDRRRCGGLWG